MNKQILNYVHVLKNNLYLNVFELSFILNDDSSYIVFNKYIISSQLLFMSVRSK